jgi:LmbE family N-acetylglucosaminyl deacetylase
MKSIADISPLGFVKESRLMVVMPHPDDEAVFAAGLISMVAKIGAKVDIVCLTDGSKSTHRFGVKPEEKLADVRRKELEDACRTMKASTMVNANFIDGTLENHHDEIQFFLLKEYKRFKPSDVLTLEPDGVYGHPDHIALTHVVTKLHQELDEAHTLLYATVPTTFESGESARKMAKKDIIQPMKPQYQLKLPLFFQYIKQQTCYAHYSQLGENQDFWNKWERFELFAHEYFVRLPAKVA